MDVFADYQTTIFIAGLTAMLLLVQLLIADFASIKSKHTPGFPIEADHDRFLFRASRVYNNTNETIAVFILLAFFGVFSQADPAYLNGFAVAYFLGRVAHMLCYYANIGLARSIAFTVSVIGLVGMFVAAWL